jgi:hypothetical protein
MNCAVCNWPIQIVREWESAGFACALFHCITCECDVAVKTPVANMNNWDSSSVEHLETEDSKLNAIQALIEDARPSKLRDRIHEILNS